MIVIVPFRSDQGHRDKLWNHLKTTYWSTTPHEIVVGEHLDGPFNRAKAINQAADRDWDVAVIADSDTWVPLNQLNAATEMAKTTNRLTAAFTAVMELSQPQTSHLLDGEPLPEVPDFDRIRTRELETQSSMLVITRALWDHIGGFDERFKGWGGEDSAMWKAAAILAGPPNRVDGFAYHMWHQPAKDKQRGPTYRRNLNLWSRYKNATTVSELRRAQCSP